MFAPQMFAQPMAAKRLGSAVANQPVAKRQRTSGGAAAAVTPAKAKFVEAIKSYQKSDELCNETWIEFVGETADTEGRCGSRDPVRHNMLTLRTFCTEYGLV